MSPQKSTFFKEIQDVIKASGSKCVPFQPEFSPSLSIISLNGCKIAHIKYWYIRSQIVTEKQTDINHLTLTGFQMVCSNGAKINNG